MGTPAMVEENVRTFSPLVPLTREERAAVERVAQILRGQDVVECTGCRYCVDGCPRRINIPELFSCLNAKRGYNEDSAGYYYRTTHTGNGHGLASECVGCGGLRAGLPAAPADPRAFARGGGRSSRRTPRGSVYEPRRRGTKQWLKACETREGPWRTRNVENNESTEQGVTGPCAPASSRWGHATHELVPAADGPMPIEGRLRKAPLRVPDNYEECSGFTLFGRRIRTLLYSTDVAAIRNSNADAIFAVYPFTAQPAITQALLTVAEAPLFVGVGGGTTTGRRAAELAAVSRDAGRRGRGLELPRHAGDGRPGRLDRGHPRHRPITRFDNEAAEKIQSGARVINVAAGRRTPEVIAELRAAFPALPIIATGGPRRRDRRCHHRRRRQRADLGAAERRGAANAT